MKTCPKCGGNLTVAYSEHTDYPVNEIHDDVISDSIDIDSEHGDTYDCELIHIHCEKCDTYWFSVQAIFEEAKA